MGLAYAIRVTYLGELGWELHIPSDQAVSVYGALFAAGADLGIGHAGLLALNSLRLEKAYRDYAIDIDNGDTLIDAGLEFTIAWEKPSGFIGKEALVKQRDAGIRFSRMVQVLVTDPEPLLYGDEQLYRDGEHVGEVRNGAYGHTLGGSVGLAMIERDEDTDDDFLLGGSWEVDIVGRVDRADVRPDEGADQGRGGRAARHLGRRATERGLGARQFLLRVAGQLRDLIGGRGGEVLHVGRE
jgi:4-methylaminobutanoate oxidase (formaldehyde-forming)